MLRAMAADADLYCVVEIPKGSRNKYEWDPELNAIRLDRFLFSSVVYPTDYGFVPETCAEDGDPLDICVLVSEPTFPGIVIHVKAIGVLRMRDEKGIDDKILSVPLHDPNWNGLNQLDDVPHALREEILNFFTIYKQLEFKEVKVDGWYDADEALGIIAAARERYEGLERGDE
jgi:inorganic pyrophosphatase